MVSRLPSELSAAWLFAQSGESASYQNLAIRLERDTENVLIGAGIKRGVQAAVGIEPPDAVARLSTQCSEGTAHENLLVPLHCQAIHRAASPGIERGVQCAVRVETTNVLICLSSQ